jgi:hypothetical protein
MSDTSKATPRPWQRQPAELDGAGYIVHFRALSRIGKVFVFPCAVGGSTKEEAEANADFVDSLLNSYNPERDKAALMLAQMMLDHTGHWCASCNRYAEDLIKFFPGADKGTREQK